MARKRGLHHQESRTPNSPRQDRPSSQGDLQRRRARSDSQCNREDVSLRERECLVTGKGNKQRPVYFDARTKVHLIDYLNSRTDSNPALFVALGSISRRVTIGGMELRLRDLGMTAGVSRVHPHKFRRTLATHAIDKGMPIEQVQKLLGHAKRDTTMHYAMVDQNNVKTSHRKYLE